MISNQEVNQGKSKFDDIYNLDDPVSYYESLCLQKKYELPELAKPYFATIIDAYLKYHPMTALKILDLGCSYGINAAILKFNRTITELYQHYTSPSRLELTKTLRRDLDYYWLHQSSFDKKLQFLGLDISKAAIDYSVGCQLLEAGICADLENQPLPRDQYSKLLDINLLISTGCIGYITEVTFDKILAAVGNPDKLWSGVFVLRVFDFSKFNRVLDKYHLVPIKTRVTIKQRKFSSVSEKKHMIELIEQQGLSAELEKISDHLFAELFLIVPRDLLETTELETLLSDLELT
ncbi:MAG: hypothetical protein F6K58_27210 [Symploca sp. SIO2E9]|nr:hypothetical protein [Symploca sp. SIO2E9]